jgi:predicted AlkP superfamily phosphohydrolase/phosphomutase
MAKMKPGDVLVVLSDHGFNSFQRGVNLNGWLLKGGSSRAQGRRRRQLEWLKDVDWSRTKAYSLGLTGMFLNLEGREANGIVSPVPTHRPSRKRSSRG